jgi:hypothetical protein
LNAPILQFHNIKNWSLYTQGFAIQQLAVGHVIDDLIIIWNRPALGLSYQIHGRYPMSERKLLSQKEVAKKFGVTENTIKNWRQRKLFSYFKAPGSSRALYFENEIEDFIQKNTKTRKGVDNRHNQDKNQGKPWISSNDDDWRIS